MLCSRREALQWMIASGLLVGTIEDAEAAETLPATGDEVPELQIFDAWMRYFLLLNRVPGGQLAITKAGQLIYSRGFGYADRDKLEPVKPTSLFRIASVSKPITAVAIMQLVERGKLKFADTIDELLEIEPHLEPDAKPDERWSKITVAMCLSHTGGWDRDKSYDPMFQQVRVAKSLGVNLPIGTAELIRYMRGAPLDFTPGERYAYSNFGYCLLGRVIEKVTGKSYEAYVQEAVFAPLDITAPKIGKSLVEERAEGEVKYYAYHDPQVMPLVGPHAGDEKAKVALSYGGWPQEVLDSHGGWITSAQDLARFAAAFDKSAENVSKPLLRAASVRDMCSPHATVKPGDRQGRGLISYGYGWTLGRENNDDKQPIVAHGGALPCTAASLVKLHDDINLAVLFNLGQDKDGNFLGRGLDGELIKLARNIEQWPAT